MSLPTTLTIGCFLLAQLLREVHSFTNLLRVEGKGRVSPSMALSISVLMRRHTQVDSTALDTPFLPSTSNQFLARHANVKSSCLL